MVSLLALYINLKDTYNHPEGSIYSPIYNDSQSKKTSYQSKVASSNPFNSQSIASVSNFNAHKNIKSVSSKDTSINEPAPVESKESSSDTTTSDFSEYIYYNTTTSMASKPPFISSSQDTSSLPSTPSSSSSPSSNTSSSSSSASSSSASVDDHKPLDKEVIEKANEISASYGISLKIPTNKGDFQSDYISSYLKDTDEAKNVLVEVEQSLESFPAEFFKKTSTTVNIVLVSKTTTEDIVSLNSQLIVPCSKSSGPNEIRSFLLSLSAKTLFEKVNPNYETYNPQGYLYGNAQTKYNYVQTHPSFGFFISSRAQTSQQEDLYENFMALFKKPSQLAKVPIESPYFNKLRYTCNLLNQWSDCFGEIEIVKRFL